MNPLVTKHCIEFDSDGSWTWKLNFLNLSTLTLDFQLARQFSWFSGAQCSRTDLNKKFTTAWKLIPKKSKISILEIHHIGSHWIDFFKKHLLLIQKGVYSDCIQTQCTLLKSSQCGGFLILLIWNLLGIGFHAVVVFGLGKDFLFKSII